jgi:hypothetical protein
MHFRGGRVHPLVEKNPDIEDREGMQARVIADQQRAERKRI